MRCNCKLEAKLKKAKTKRDAYIKRCARISKIIANREGKKLRLVVWDYKEGNKSTMYVAYTKFAEVRFTMGREDSENVFHMYENLDPVPWKNSIDNLWEKNGGKISHVVVEFCGKHYRLDNQAQLWEVRKTGIFKRVWKNHHLIFAVREELKK